jgi:hypothetical protein
MLFTLKNSDHTPGVYFPQPLFVAPDFDRAFIERFVQKHRIMATDTTCVDDICLNELLEFELPDSIGQLMHLDATPLGKDFVPSNYCVLCGRGKELYDSVGNRRFRCIADMYLDQYSKTKAKIGKSIIVDNILSIIKDAGGVFCKFEHGCWWQVSESAARDKVGAYFRACLQHRPGDKVTRRKTMSPASAPTEHRPEGTELMRDERRHSM